MDILLLQETWLLDTEVCVLSNLHEHFYAKGLSAMNTGGGLITGRPHRGIAILWRKTMGPRCTIKEFDDPRIMGLEVSCGSSSILIVNVYFPYACEDNAD